LLLERRMTILTPGTRLPLHALGLGTTLRVQVDCDLDGTDVCAFGLTDGTLADDRFMVFFNQPSSPEGAIRINPGTQRSFNLDLGRLDSKITEIVFTATHDASPLASAGTLRVQLGEHLFDALPALKQERAVMLIRLYRRNDEWRVGANGQGFDGGLSALVHHFGGEVAQPQELGTAEPPAPTLPPASLNKVELRKNQVTVELRKLGIEAQKFRVFLVLDASGSMIDTYSNGSVQEVLERIVPVASRLDSDGQLEALYYAETFADLGLVDEHTMIGRIGKRPPQATPRPPGYGFSLFRRKENRNAQKTAETDKADAVVMSYLRMGLFNNEPKVMAEIIRRWHEDPTGKPTLVLFLNDGGVSRNDEIQNLLRTSSGDAIFWQFIGVGNGEYGVLRNLSSMTGRKVDNAGFFAVDDLNKISDEELYARLLSELPKWLARARKLGIVT